MKNTIFVLALSIALSACSEQTDNAADNSDLINTAMAAVKAIAKDPSSVQFRNLTEKNYCVSGEYNAKNTYGGYVGFQSFTYRSETVYTRDQYGNNHCI